MIATEEIDKLLQEIILDPKIFVVFTKVSPSNIRKKITVLVDSDDGISIDQCAEISRELGVKLDELIEVAFTLEVSSPGTDFPLTTERQFRRNLNRTLKVIFKDGKTVKGVLKGVTEDSITIQEDKKKKEKQAPEPLNIILTDIKEALVQVSFK